MIDQQRSDFDRARDLLSAGDPVNAELLLHGLLDDHGGIGAIHFLLGLCLDAQGKLGPALEALGRAIDLMPDDPAPRLVCAAIFENNNQRAAAASQYQAAAITFPHHGAVWAEIGRFELANGDPDRANGALVSAIACDPTLAMAYYYLANIGARAGAIDRHIIGARRASLLGFGAEAFDLWALGLADQGDPDAAQAIFQQRALYFGASFIADLAAGEWAMELEDFSRAIGHFRSAIIQQPQDGAIWRALGSALDASAAFPAARLAFKHAAMIGDRAADPWVRLYDHTPLSDETLFARVTVEALGQQISHSIPDLAITKMCDVDVVGNQWYLERGRTSSLAHADHKAMLALPFLQNDSSMLRASSTNGLALSVGILDELPIERAILFGDSANYYHWLIDELPNAAGLEALDPDLPILCGYHLADYHHDALARIGVNPDRLLRVEPMARRRAGQLFVLHPPQTGLSTAQLISGLSPSITPDRANWLRQKFPPSATVARRRRWYISRSRALVRRIVNEDELISRLNRRGFDVLHLEGLKLQDQIDLFQTAEIVTGPHGAGFANMVFAPDDACLLELMPPGALPPYFEALATARGQRYDTLIGRASQSLKPRKRGWWPFYMDPDRLDQKLDELGF